MKNKYLLDTNTVIYFFNGITDDKKIEKILKDSFNISIITKIEFLSWQKLLENIELNNKAIEFISYAYVYDINETVANQTIKIRQQYNIKTPDAIIGATAMVYGFDIVTNNINDFKNLDLNIIPIKLKSR